MSFWDTYARFPKHRIAPPDAREICELSEYSGTIPTGVTPGKRWRRHDGAFANDGLMPVWLLCEYGPEIDGSCAINRYRPLVRIPARTSAMIVLTHGQYKKVTEGNDFVEWCNNTLGYLPKLDNLFLTHIFPRETRKPVLIFRKTADMITAKMWL